MHTIRSKKGHSFKKSRKWLARYELLCTVLYRSDRGKPLLLVQMSILYLKIPTSKCEKDYELCTGNVPGTPWGSWVTPVCRPPPWCRRDSRGSCTGWAGWTRPGPSSCWPGRASNSSDPTEADMWPETWRIGWYVAWNMENRLICGLKHGE